MRILIRLLFYLPLEMTQRDFDGFLKIGTIIVIVSAIICTVFGLW